MATLYHVPTSRSLRVLWTLEEIGATVEVKSLGVRPRLQEPEYLAINPAGTLPALIDGDRAIYESLAICEYLAARHGSDLIVAPGAAGIRAMAVVRRGDASGATLGDGACRPYPEQDAGDAGRHRCRAVRRAPLALDAGKATRAATGGSRLPGGGADDACRHFGRLSAQHHGKAPLRLAARSPRHGLS
jgi:glutathione S-transferase